MRDRFILPLLALVAIAMVALAFVWPQGQGRRSPDPFGHPMATPREDKVTAGGRTIGAIRGRQPGADGLPTR
jgi:hypothetical protein